MRLPRTARDADLGFGLWLRGGLGSSNEGATTEGATTLENVLTGQRLCARADDESGRYVVARLTPDANNPDEFEICDLATGLTRRGALDLLAAIGARLHVIEASDFAPSHYE